MANHKLVQIIITFNVFVLNLFFKIKAAKVNRVFRRIARGGQDEVEEEGGVDAVLTTKPSTRTALGANHARKSELLTAKEPVIGSVKNQSVNWTSFGLVDQSACSNLPNIDRFAKYCYQFTELYYWYLLIKNFILCLLRYDTFARWRFLDCYLLGRYIINGRVIELTPYCACYIAILRLIWIYTMARRMPEFRMPCVEFLLDKRGHAPYWSRGSDIKAGTRCYRHHSALLEYRNPFYRMHNSDLTAADPFKLRPNRTRETWNALGQTVIVYETILVIIFILLGILFFLMGLPVVLTRRGVEYNYRYCLHWLSKERARGSTSWLSNRLHELFMSNSNSANGPANAIEKYVQPAIIQDVYLPFAGLVNLSLFHAFRSTLEVFETAVLYLDIGLLLSAACFMTTICSKDIQHYCNSINQRLNRHILTRQGMPPTSSSLSLSVETSDIQAQVADLFLMLDSYNRYMSRQIACLLIYWFGYSGLVSSWIFVPGNESPKLEWYVIHCCTTLYVILLLVHMSEVRASCRRMYRLVSLAMGLDEDHKARKSVWLSLLKFYKPRPLYCFTIIGSIEINYMLGLKLMVWLLSALIVGSSFFQVYNIK